MNKQKPEDVQPPAEDALLQELATLRQQLADLRNEKISRVESALRESEERFRVIAETLPIPVVISHPSGRLVYANAPAIELLGLDGDDIAVYHLETFYVKSSEYPRLLALLEEDGCVQGYEAQCVATDGTRMWVEQSMQQLVLNHAPYLLSTFYDITGRKQDEQERLRLTANLRGALQQQVTLTNAYSRFVPREILTFLEKEDITQVSLGDQSQREMTLLFSDIRNFTSLSEQMTPQENFNFLNSYLSRVSPIIRQHHGFIDKYLGDGIMALFPEHANDAIQAAIKMQEQVITYNQHRANHGYRPISIGVGVHTGKVMLGTVGEAERMEATVISDAVNLAARLEGLTKLYDVPLVVSESTLFKLDRLLQYNFRFLDKVKVKGKSAPVSVFEIIDGNPPDVVALRLQTQHDFEKGQLHYHSEEFQEAVTYFQRVLDVDADDRAAQLYLQRAKHYIEYGLPVNWEGIEAITDK